MDIRKVKKLIELLEESGIAEIEIHEGEESVRISRQTQSAQVFAQPMVVPQMAPLATAVAPGAPGAPGAPAATEAEALPAGQTVRSPMVGQVHEVLRRPGELIQGDGILELGRVDRMYAIAEVYETDIHNVHVGQKATITSDALDGPLSGTVERISLKVQKHDEIGVDPAAHKDARIIEVKILLDDPEPAAALTFLQVEVVIGS